MSNYHIKSELNQINNAVRDNKDVKVLNNGQNITVVGVDNVAPDFVKSAEVNVKTGAFSTNTIGDGDIGIIIEDGGSGSENLS